MRAGIALIARPPENQQPGSGTGHEAPEQKGPDAAGASEPADTSAGDTPPAGDAGKPTSQD